jgi:hypothetical protein
MRPVRYLLTDLCATVISDWMRRAARSCWSMLLVPSFLVAAARGSAQPSALKAIELYQGLIRPFQRWRQRYELRCGQLYVRTIAAFAGRR